MNALRAVLAALLLPLPACTGLPPGWSQAQRITGTSTPAGAWIGTWRSTPTGHTGKLRCAVFPKSPGVWQYRYRATWAKILCAGFTVDCTATPLPGGGWSLTGTRDLGPAFGGIFTHKGTLRGPHLNATYQAAADHGTLTLERLASE
jgi:hypothetical protein